MKRLALSIFICAALSAGVFTGCANASQTSSQAPSPPAATATTSISENATGTSSGEPSDAPAETPSEQSGETPSSSSAPAADVTGAAALDASDMFTERDLEQQADTSEATAISVTSGEDVNIAEEGVYVLSGTAADVTVTVNADESAKVQLVLDGLSITNENAPAIYVESADKVFVTTAAGTTNELIVTGEFASTDPQGDVDGVIFSKDDITFNGEGLLNVSSSDNGIVGKDDVKFTGGTFKITAGNHAIRGKDSVRIADGAFELTATKDGIHAENPDDQTLGYVYIADGTFAIQAGSDGIEGDAVVQIDGGSLDIDAEEGIEGTYVQINGGDVKIKASDDGINASSKSTEYDIVLEINGGNVEIDMDSGDTDALDSNGALVINGGTVDIAAQFAFDFVTRGELNGGTVTVNGEQVSEITESMMMGGPGMGGFGGREGFSGEPPQDGFSGEMPSGEPPQGGFGKHGGHDDQGKGNRGSRPDSSSDSAATSDQMA